MKLRPRIQLYISLAHFIPLLFLFIFYIFIGIKTGFLQLAAYQINIIGFGIALVTGFIFIWITGSYVQSLLNRMKELNDFFGTYLNPDLPELNPDPHFDELGKLRQLLIEMLQRLNKRKAELEDRYKKLLLSHMNLEEKYAQSYTIQLVLEEISRELDSEHLLKKTSDIILGVFGSRRCTIYMVDEENECLQVKADSGSMEPNSEINSIPFDAENIIARAWRTKQILTEAEAKVKELKPFKSRNVPSFTIFPLTGWRGGLGVIIIEHQSADGLSSDLKEFAKLIAQEISLSVENAYLYEKMRQMANHDALTGVYNRMFLMNYVAEIFSKVPDTVSVVMFDLDFFKKINDKYGHLAGDMVLKSVTAIMQKMLPTGIIGRYGGEEFVIILPKVNQLDAFKLADNIRVKISEHNFINSEGIRIPVTISAGVANYPQVSDSFKGLLQLADEALYEAKKSGKNKVCIAGWKEASVQNGD